MVRFLPFRRYDPYFKTGLNKALMDSVREPGEKTVFLAGWDKKCVNLGYSQSFEEEVNVEEFGEREDVILVRRQGGGGATFLTPEGEITWGIIDQEENRPEDVNRIYERVCGRIAEGLKEIGIEAEHEPVNDIVTDKGKISGATIKKEKNVVYIGGTLLYENDPEQMFSLLTPDREKMQDKKIQNYKERVTSVSKESEASFDQARKALKSALLSGADSKISSITDSERRKAEQLAVKYSDEEWLYRE